MSDLKTLLGLLRGRSPGQLIVQLTDACNAKCPQCELRASSPFKRAHIPLDHVKRMIDVAAERGVQALSFTGGEPFLRFDDLVELIRHAGKAGIKYTRTGTNGFFLRDVEEPDWERRIRGVVERLAETDLYTLWISLDSAHLPTHEKMRGLPGVTRGIEKALPIFHEHGIYPAANLGINRNAGGPGAGRMLVDAAETDPESFRAGFAADFRSFYRTVVQMGFTMVNACYPMSVQESDDDSLSAVYGASSSNRVVHFSPAEKRLLFGALLETLPLFRDRIRIFTPTTSLYLLTQAYGEPRREGGYPCRGGADYFFVDAQTAHAYPCGFRGEDLGAYDDPEFRPADATPQCRACDWECYRDPSDLLGPLLELRDAPLALLRRFLGDPEHRRRWWSDVRYAAACEFFSGRKAPDYAKLARFTPKSGARAPLGASPEESAALRSHVPS